MCYRHLVSVLLSLAFTSCLTHTAPDSRRIVSQPEPGYGSSDEQFSDAPYVFETIEKHIRFEADGRGQRDTIFRLRIQSESAVREFGLIVYPYSSSFESLDVVYLRVRKPDGTVLETQPAEIQELDSPVSRVAPMYTDQREKHIPVKSLAVGDILEAHFRWTIHDPIAPGHFWFDYAYYTAGICLKETLQIDVPANLQTKLRNAQQQPSVREEQGRRIYMFANSNLKKREESRIPPWERYFHGAPPPDIQLSSFSSWDEVGQWFASLALPKAAVTPEIKAKAEELIKGKSTEEEKARALYTFVSTRFRYIGIDLGLSRYTPHAAAEVLSNRYGDCKDKHTLFASLLQAVGITSYPALISSRLRVDPSFPTPSVFDHVITAIPRGNAYQFLDTTPEVTPFGLLTANLRDRQALVIPGARTIQLVATPADPPFPFFERTRIDSSLDASGTLDAKVSLENRGDGEIALRQLYRATPQNEWQNLTQKIANSMGFGGTVSDVNVTQPEETDKPLTLTFSYRRTDYPDWKKRRIVLPLPGVVLLALNEEQKASTNPLPLGPPQDITIEATMKLPPGYSVYVPGKVEQKEDFAEYSAVFSLENDALRGVFRFKTKVREIPGTERSQYTTLAKTMDETARRYIPVIGNPATEVAGSGTGTNSTKEVKILGSKSETSATNPSPATARPAKPLYDAAVRAQKNTNYAVSAQLYEQTVAQDPKYAEAWNNLGYVYAKLGQHAKSEVALRKALALDPSSRFAHVNLGNALREQRKYEEAIPEYKKELEINPKDNLAHLSLSVAYVLGHHYEQAIPELELSAANNPDNPSVQFNLGVCYAKTEQPEKAVSAFTRSVEIEPTAERKNIVAYQMALNKLQLDQAEKYIKSAIDLEVSKTKDLSLDNLSNDDIRVPPALGAFWDTMGWVKFQQGDLPAAEKYLLSAWRLRSIGEIGDHLGQIYAKRGQKEEAEKFYAMALASPGPMPDTQMRLSDLAGSSTETERITKAGTTQLAEDRTIEFKNPKSAEGAAEFWILLAPGPRVDSVKFISGDEALRSLTTDLKTVVPPYPFPDSMDLKLLRRGKLTCPPSSQVCRFSLASSETVRQTN
jgi:tetratricopeptide (TPR) repeat protein